MFGEAHLVHERSTGETLVIKHVPLDGLDEVELACALKEVGALQKLVHPNIVRYRDSWVSATGRSGWSALRRAPAEGR